MHYIGTPEERLKQSTEFRLPPRITPQNYIPRPRFDPKNPPVGAYHVPLLDARVLTCQNSDISIWAPSKDPKNKIINSSSSKKTEVVMELSILRLAELYGEERLGFLTLTHADGIKCTKENQRRWNSLATNELRHRYTDYIAVVEFTKKGTPHMHLIVVMKEDIKTGYDLNATKQGDFSSASTYLKKEWKYFRGTPKEKGILEKYNFGYIHNLEPIRTNAKAMAKYMCKYMTKSLENRTQEHKGARLVRYSKNARAGSTKMSWISIGASIWRAKVAEFAKIVGMLYPDEIIECVQDLSRVLGPKWAYVNRDYIYSIQLPDIPETPL
jgi:hypothetical protein